jgi:hypothetical protein
MKTYTKDQIEKAIKSKGYVWFEDANNKGYDVNIVGIRTSETGKKVTNVFDDLLTIAYKVNGAWVFKQWLATADPGTKGVVQFHNPNGVARLVPGQYRGSHHLGLHQGKYLALKQQKPVKVYRDANKDAIYDESRIQEGIFGINIHKAGANSERVESWSEGCQVFKRSADFEEFLSICKKASEIHGNSFTYTLIESKDIK